MEVSRDVPDGSNNDNPLRMCFWRVPNQFQLLQWLLGCCFSPCSEAAGFQSYCTIRDKVMRAGQVKMPTENYFLLWPKFSKYSWINASWTVASLRLTSSIQKKLVLTIFFANVLIAFMEKWLFGSLYSAIPTNLTHAVLLCLNQPESQRLDLFISKKKNPTRVITHF